MDPPQKKTLKKIWFFAYGTRGDIQPYVAVGAALRQKGYQVTFFTSEKYADFASEYGLQGIPSAPFIDDLIRQSPDLKKCMASGDARTVFDAVSREQNKHNGAKCAKLLEEVQRQGVPDLCITMDLSTYFGWYLALEHKVPFLNTMTFAFSYNPDHMHMGLPRLPFGLHYPLFYNLIIDLTMDGTQTLNSCMGTDYVEFGRKYCRAQMRDRDLPMIVLMSPEIAPILFPPNYASPQLRFVGTTVLEKHQQLDKPTMFGGKQELDNIRAFLNADHKPIYVGWGSMISKSPEHMIEFCVRAIYHSQQRAIVLGGVAELSLELLLTLKVEHEILDYAKKNILFVQHAPHEWLFPRVAATVHHGGAGTTTASLRGGTPTIITPVLIDQFDFSYVVRKLGVGVGFEKQLHKIAWKELGEAIKTVVMNAEFQRRAAELGTRLNQENGAQKAAEEVEEFWKEYYVTGKFQQLFPGQYGEKLNETSSSFWEETDPVAVGIKYLLKKPSNRD